MGSEKTRMTAPMLTLAWLLLFLLLSTGTALAVGTPAGTNITNKATATYTDANSNVYTPVDSNVVTVTVSQVAGLTITPTSSTQNAAPAGSLNYAMSITNTGNGSDTFNVATSGLPAGYTVTVYKDTNGDGILQPGEAVAGNTLGSSVTLAADQVQRVIAVVTVPAGAASGSTAPLNLTATSTLTPATTATATATTTIQAAVVSFTKTASPATPKPGDVVTYTISWSNGGTAPAYLAVLTDPIPANTTYKAASITYNGAVRTDVSDADNADFNVTNAGKVTVNIGTVAAGGTGSATFQVTVNAGIASTTLISNTASASYRTNAADPTTTTTVNSNSAPFTVAQKAGIQVLPATLTTDELVGNQNLHPFTIKNTGNGTDTYTISSVGKYWTWTIYNDVDHDGKYTPGVDTPITDTNGDGKKDTGPMAAGDTNYYIAVTTVTGYNGQQGMHTMTATSLADAAVSGASIKYTNIQTPVISLVKSVSPTGPQPPGALLTYTVVVTNSGAAPAINFVVTDGLNANLKYLPGSIAVAGAAQTDAADGDFGRYDTTSGTIFITLPSIAASNVPIPITYKATIK